MEPGEDPGYQLREDQGDQMKGAVAFHTLENGGLGGVGGAGGTLELRPEESNCDSRKFPCS